MPPAADRHKSGVPGLDEILFGGLVPFRLYLIEGDPGAGKTTLGLHFVLEGVRQGEKCLYVTLSESKDELVAGAESHGWSLAGVDVVELAAGERELNLDTQVTMYAPSEVELTETTKAILDAVIRTQPTRVVIDSLSELRLLAQGALRFRRQILALKHFFVGRRCTVLLLDDQRSEPEALQLHSIGHGVVTLEQLSPLYGAERRRLRVVKMRGRSYRGGYHDFRIQRGGLCIYPRLVSAEHRQSVQPEPVSSGISGLDTLLGGGPDRGTSTLLMGPAGSGKSSIALQYATAAAQRGDQAVVFAFDESLTTLEARMAGLGIDFRAGYEAKKVQLEQVDPAELSPGEFTARVRDAVERDQARVVVIDSLNGYLNAMPQEQFLTLQLHELLAYLGAKGITTFLVVAQHGLVGSAMSAPVDTSYLADTVVLFRFFETAGRVKKAISVVKKRSGRHEDTIRELRFSSGGISVSEPLAGLHGVLTGVPMPSAATAPLLAP